MGHTSKAPAGYQPTQQAGADAGMYGATNYMADAGKTLADTTIPGLQGVTDAMTNNPYYGMAQQGANQAADIGMNNVAPAQFGMAQSAMTAGNALGAAGQQSAQAGMTDYNNAKSYLPQVMAGYGQGAPGLVQNARAGAAQLQNSIPQATAGYGLAMPAYQQAQTMAQNTSQGYQYAPQVLQDAYSKANTVFSEGQDLAAMTIPQLLQSTFDPQNALYDRSYQQMQQQTNAGAAQQGVSGSPFAAGLASDASRNFNTDWQNQQLQREVTGAGAIGGLYSNLISGGAGAYGSLTGQGVNSYNSLNAGSAGNFANLTNAGTGQFNDLTNSATSNLRGLVGDSTSMVQNALQNQFNNVQTSSNNAVSQYGQMLGSATGAKTAGMNDLYNGSAGQMNAYGAASDLGAAGLNTMTTSAMYPNQVYANNQNQILSAYLAQIQGTNQALQPTQNAITDYSNYMKLGQSATQNAQQAAQLNNAAQASQMSGITGLAGMALAPFTGGMSLGMAGGMGGSAAGANIGNALSFA